MKKAIWITSIFLTLFFVFYAQAQFGKTPGPKFYSDFKPVVGSWSEYQVTSKGEPPSKMKMAVVGKEGDSYWYETIMESKKEGRIITKMLVSGDPEDPKNLKRMVIKTGSEPAMEMPVQMIGQSHKGQGQPGKVVDKGTETIQVPAGSFSTKHMQYQDSEGITDTWVYKNVSPYGIIKSQSKNFEMVLTGYGTGAKTLIIEKPQKFEMPGIHKGVPKGGRPGKDIDDEGDED
jgi:hypothetical protein